MLLKKGQIMDRGSKDNEDGETLEQANKRGCRCSIPGNIRGQVGRGSEQSDIVEDVPGPCRGVGLNDL